ncbi:hypothetical protein [Thiorhodovibrio frisius]|nr:hypothetical protein [Thiorhodovibrio frisius]
MAKQPTTTCDPAYPRGIGRAGSAKPLAKSTLTLMVMANPED